MLFLKSKNPSITLELLPDNQLNITCNLANAKADDDIHTQARRFAELVFVMFHPRAIPRLKSAIGAAHKDQRYTGETILQIEQLTAEVAAHEQERTEGPDIHAEIVPPGRMFSPHN